MKKHFICAHFSQRSWTSDNCKKKTKNQFKQEPWEDDGEPVDDLKEGGDAESKTEAKEAPQGGEELDWTHSNLPLQFWGE